MPNAYYTCNLLPLELIARAGYSPRWLGEHLQDPGAPARRDALSIHPLTCPYVTRLVAAADALFDGVAEDDVLLVPGGCDAMRRMGDLLAATYPGQVFVLSLARSSGEAVVRQLAADLADLEAWLEEKAAAGDGTEAKGQGTTDVAGAEAGIEATITQTPRVDYPSPPRPGGVFVVAGPLTDDSLLRLIGQLGAWVSGLESCTSPDRWKPLAVAGARGIGLAAAGTDGAGPRAAGAHATGVAATHEREDTDYYLNLADQVLTLGICPRRSTVERRNHLVGRLDECRPSSIIYARQSFCDPGAYDALLVAELAEERGLPYLEIEVGFPFEAGGPLRTRVEAFLEAQLLDDDLLDDLLDTADFEAVDFATGPDEED
jgi:2-hydroxyglutaryl-CoA dehydratase, D-component